MERERETEKREREMADSSRAAAAAEDGISSEESPTSVPRSFSYRLDTGPDLLGSRRSSSSSLLGSRHQSTDSLFGSRRSSAYGSRYGFGNTYVQVDDTGIYLSSLAVTIVLSALATIGILLFTLVVTLAIMLGQCQDKPVVVNKPNRCESFALNGELNNLQNWMLPQECVEHAANYVDSGQYYVDFALAIDAARTYLRSVVVESDGFDMVVLDLDDTMLSSLPFLRDHHFGAEAFTKQSWDSFLDLASMPPLEQTLSLYDELKALNWKFAVISERAEEQRNMTMKNLSDAGYEDFILVLRSGENEGPEFKSNERVKFESQGYRLWAVIGDQWSDLTGKATGKRTFKLPNSLYYI